MLVMKWAPWVRAAVDIMDANGAFIHLPYEGGQRAQPGFDMGVLRFVRNQWVKRMNAKVESTRQVSGV